MKIVNIWNELRAKEKVSAIFSMLGLLGLLLVYMQIGQASRSLESNAGSLMMSSVQDLNKLFVEHPELWPYFHEKKHINKGEDDYYRVLAAADFHIDLIESIWTQSAYIDAYKKDSEAWDGWHNWFTSLTSNSPILCERVSHVQTWYAKDFIAYLNRFCVQS